MLSQAEDNRKQLVIPEMSNINSETAEKDLIKIWIHFREFSCMATLREQNIDGTTRHV